MKHSILLFRRKVFLMLLVLVNSVFATAQVRVPQPTENLFDESNLLVVSYNNRNLGLLSYEYVVTVNSAERLYVLYLLDENGIVLFDNGYNCSAAETITFDNNAIGRATRTVSSETFGGNIFIAADGSVTYNEVANANDAILTPYKLVDKRQPDNVEEYALVKIGSQVWMRENLRAKTLANGVDITTNLNKDDWEATVSPAYTVYDNQASNLDTMGALYNWYAVNNSEPLAAEGWGIPSLADWNKLVIYISPETFNPAPNEEFSISFTAGELLKSTAGWAVPPVSGGGTLQPGNNLVMLNCQPFGSTSTSQYFNGYSGKQFQGYFWTADQDEDETSKSIFIRLFWDSQTINYNREDKFMGYSVRCLSTTPIKIEQQPTTMNDNINSQGEVYILSANEGNISLSIPEYLMGNDIVIFNMNGVEVFRQVVDTNIFNIRTGELAKGVYVIRVGGNALKVVI